MDQQDSIKIRVIVFHVKQVQSLMHGPYLAVDRVTTLEDIRNFSCEGYLSGSHNMHDMI